MKREYTGGAQVALEDEKCQDAKSIAKNAPGIFSAVKMSEMEDSRECDCKVKSEANEQNDRNFRTT